MVRALEVRVSAEERSEPGPAQSGPAQSAEPSFEQILDRLQHVVERLESGELPLEESLAVFEEGVRLSRLGARRLDDAERRVEELLVEGDTPRTRPLPSGRRGSDDDDAHR
jgi:exodeoxyribonuclease VII small subunit